MLRALARVCGLVADTPRPPDIDPDTLAGAYQLGEVGGSGMVAEPAQALNYVNAGGRRDDVGHFVVPGTAQPFVDGPPASALVDRPLFGGVRTAPATREYVETPGMSGGYVVISGRPDVQLGQISVVQPAPVAVTRSVPSAFAGSCNDRAGASIGPVDLADLQRDTLADSLGWDRR